jgi:hypothetical protein
MFDFGSVSAWQVPKQWNELQFPRLRHFLQFPKASDRRRSVIRPLDEGALLVELFLRISELLWGERRSRGEHRDSVPTPHSGASAQITSRIDAPSCETIPAILCIGEFHGIASRAARQVPR